MHAVVPTVLNAGDFYTDIPYGTVICNPPYGERLLELEEARDIYEGFGYALKKAPELKKYIISSDEKFEDYFGKKADKKRKLYNGMIKCNLYMYFK